MTEQEMWSEYKKLNPEANEYEAWKYGGGSPQMSNLLADLTLKGVKTATAGPYACYIAEQEPLPEAGDYNLILNTEEEAVCITRTTKVYTVPFYEVPEEQAYKEGEFDRTLSSWRAAHKTVFTKYLKEIGQKFDKNMLVVCEEFEKVYPVE